MLDDAPAVAALIAARDAADLDQHDPDFTPDELRDWWASGPGRLDDGSWIALDGDRAVGFAKLHVEGDCAELQDDSCVHPDWRGRGIGTTLLDRFEEWAGANGCARVRAGVLNDDGRALLARTRLRARPPLLAHGDRAQRGAGAAGLRGRCASCVRIVRATTTAPCTRRSRRPSRITGITRREPLEKWLHGRTVRGDYDPALWVVAEADGAIAGAALAFGSRDFGWVLDLGVRRPWRGRGLGHALLLGVFGELYRRGFTRVGLEVDAASETGATRLYERAGMRVTRRYDWYERRL